MKNLRIYHFNNADQSAFRAALEDYLESSGRHELAAIYRKASADVRKGVHGKPYFCEPALEDVFFSKSNTQGHEIVCFSDREVGVDCENIKARPGIETRFAGISRKYFTDDEQEYLRASSEGGIERFFEIWTAKEAYMKYTGKGFSEGFRTFSVFHLPGEIVKTGHLPDAPYVIYSVCNARAHGAPENRTRSHRPVLEWRSRPTHHHGKSL